MVIKVCTFKISLGTLVSVVLFFFFYRKLFLSLALCVDSAKEMFASRIQNGPMNVTNSSINVSLHEAMYSEKAL